MRSRMPPGCVALAVLLVFAVLLPIFLADLLLVAMSKLGLGPELSLAAVFGIFFGSMINLPIQRIPREETIPIAPVRMFGLGRFFPTLVRRRTYTVIAVNVGGALVPTAIAVYELVRLAGIGGLALGAGLGAVAVNVAVCYWVARPVPKLGITMPALVPALVAAICALAFARELAPPIAFSAGVLGPLVGADLLHYRQIKEIGAGVASIGGAGTFDGIVLSGLVATLLA